MNGIGNAFIWTAIACGPVLLLVLATMSAVRVIRKPARVGSTKGAPPRRHF